MKIKALKLISEPEIQFGDFNVFVGGNGVGKTTLLLEIHAEATGVNRNKYFWLDGLEYKSDNIAADMDMLNASIRKLFTKLLKFDVLIYNLNPVIYKKGLRLIKWNH